MIDLRDRFRALESVEAPDLREEILARPVRPDFSPPGRERLVAGLAAALIGLAGIAAGGWALLRLAGEPREPYTEPVRRPEIREVFDIQRFPGGREGVGIRGRMLARVQEGDRTWILSVTRSRRDEALCLHLNTGKVCGGPTGTGTGVIGVFGSSELGPDEQVTFVYGFAHERVAAVEVIFDSGTTIRTRPIEGPESLDVNVYVVGIRGTASRTAVRAFDRSGAPLDTIPDDEPPSCCQEDVLDQHKATVYYPLDWQRAPRSLIVGLQDATEIASLGTSVMEPGVDECPGIPERALEGLGAADSLVTIQEVVDDATFGPRPRIFTPQRGVVPEEAACLENADRIDLRAFTFSDEGRSFRAYLGYGERASQETREEALAILTSFLVCDPASPPGNCL